MKQCSSLVACSVLYLVTITIPRSTLMKIPKVSMFQSADKVSKCLSIRARDSWKWRRISCVHHQLESWAVPGGSGDKWLDSFFYVQCFFGWQWRSWQQWVTWPSLSPCMRCSWGRTQRQWSCWHFTRPPTLRVSALVKLHCGWYT